MSRGGKREGAGRKPGALSMRARAHVIEARKGGMLPLDFLLSVMRDETNGRDLRIEAAKAAAPYLHSKMPVALVPAQPAAAATLDRSDDEILNTYLGGIHAEAEQD